MPDDDTPDETVSDPEAADRTITDPEEIRRWAEERDVVPAYVARGSPAPEGPALVRREELPDHDAGPSWEEFFEHLERERLALALDEDDDGPRYGLVRHEEGGAGVQTRSEQDRPTTADAEEEAPSAAGQQRDRPNAPDRTMADESAAASERQTPETTEGADPTPAPEEPRETASAAGRGDPAGGTTVDKDDVGKPVRGENGEELGTVSEVSPGRGTLYVRVAPDVPADVLTLLEWGDGDEQPLSVDQVTEVTEDAVWVWVADR